MPDSKEVIRLRKNILFSQDHPTNRKRHTKGFHVTRELRLKGQLKRVLGRESVLKTWEETGRAERRKQYTGAGILGRQ